MVKFFQTDEDWLAHFYTKKPKRQNMIKTWLQEFLGISDIKTKLTSMDSDITSIMTKQLDQELETIPPDPPEVDKDSPYEYIMNAKMSAEETAEYNWWIIWSTGFAGPFNTFMQAHHYKTYNNLNKTKFCDIQILCRRPFTIKK